MAVHGQRSGCGVCEHVDLSLHFISSRPVPRPFVLREPFQAFGELTAPNGFTTLSTLRFIHCSRALSGSMTSWYSSNSVVRSSRYLRCG